MDDAMVLYIADMVMELQARESTDLPLLKQQLAETEKAIKNMLDAIQQGIFNSSTKMRLDELEENKSKLEVSILQEEMQKPLLTKEQVTFWICRFREIDVTKQEQRQRLIDSFVNAVYLYDDKLIITFNYKDGAKTVSLTDIKGSDLTSLAAPRRRKQNNACGDFLQRLLLRKKNLLLRLCPCKRGHTTSAALAAFLRYIALCALKNP